jgi:diacylglycerol kinase family enzyme
VEELDLGVVNGKNFLTRLSFGLELGHSQFDFFGTSFVSQLFNKPSIQVRFHAEKFHAESEVLGGMIINCQNYLSNNLGQPTDGLLDVVLIPKLSRTQLFSHRKNILEGRFDEVPGASIVHLDSLEITSPSGLPLKIGDRELATTPARVEIKPKALKLIVGRGRKFD